MHSTLPLGELADDAKLPNITLVDAVSCRHLDDLPLDILVKIFCFLDRACLKQLRLVSTRLGTAALWCVKTLRLYRRPGSEFGPWDPLESLPCLKRIECRIGLPDARDWEAYKKPWQRRTLTLGARRCLPLLAELVIDGIQWECVDDFDVGRLQHSLQMTPNLTKLVVLRCNDLPSTLFASCTSVCDLKINSNTMLGSLGGPLMTMSNLQRLSLRWNRVWEDPHEYRMWHRLLELALAYLPKLTNLEQVVVVSREAVSTLAGLHQLTRLAVIVRQVDGMVPVGPFFRMRGLAVLGLTAEGPGQASDFAEGAPSLADLQQATQLRALMLCIWDDDLASVLPWHPLCSALAHLTELTQLCMDCASDTPTSALRLFAMPLLIKLRFNLRQDASEDMIWPILCRAAPLLQHLDLDFPSYGQLFSLVQYLRGLPSLTRLSMRVLSENDEDTDAIATKDWPSPSCVLCHRSLRHLLTYHMFHAANINRDLPLLLRQGMDLQSSSRADLAMVTWASVNCKTHGVKVYVTILGKHVTVCGWSPCRLLTALRQATIFPLCGHT